jgi:hypothetical protein
MEQSGGEVWIEITFSIQAIQTVPLLDLNKKTFTRAIMKFTLM